MSPHESTSRVIYEVNLKVHPSVIDEYKVWLVKHAHNMLKLEGIMSMTVSTLDDDEDGRYFVTRCPTGRLLLVCIFSSGSSRFTLLLIGY